MTIAAIVNPISGAALGTGAASRRVATLRRELDRRALKADIQLTTAPGHAELLAAAARDAGTELVLVWGGDGTVNEVGRALAGSETALGLIPAGSGNGLAAALGVPRDPTAAINRVLDGQRLAIDVGMLGERPFFNVAGIGFDARVARLFNGREKGSRGRWPYVVIGVREGCTYCAEDYRVRLDSDDHRLRALLVVFANGREFGMGAQIAPVADLRDGLLDAVVVEDRPLARRFWDARHLAFGSVARAPRILTRQVRMARVEADVPLEFHVDGEPGVFNGALEVGIRPKALWVQG